MEVLIENVVNMPVWSKMANLHGMLAMLSLILFGASFVLLTLPSNSKKTTDWLKHTLLLLFTTLLFLDLFGLMVYVPYRVEGGPRTILKSSEATDWLHSVVFEHKEFLAFAPVILIFAAYFVVVQLDEKLFDNKNVYLKRSVLISLLLSLIFVLTVAGEAVLVTKVVPI